MNLIAFSGLGILLGLAYAMSNNKRIIPWRVLFYGLALQLLFGAIVLKENAISFLGLLVFITWIIYFLLHRQFNQMRSITGRILVITDTALVTAVFYFLQQIGIAIFLLPVLLIWLLYVRFQQQDSARPLAIGLLLTSTLGILIQKGIHGKEIFQAFSVKVDAFLRLSDLGTKFLFGRIISPEFQETWGYQFAFIVLPTIIFFASVISILYHLGVMQSIIKAFARFMQWNMGTSGSETLSCTANMLVGQTEAPLLVKPFLKNMTPSELHTIMVGGFATIAGGVMAGYIRMGIDAGHIIAASVMSAPAALVVGKLMYPETQKSETYGSVEIPVTSDSVNLLDAASQGVTDGLKLAVNVAAMLIAFIALIGLIDVSLNWLDRLIDGNVLGGEFVPYSQTGFSPNTGEYSGVFPGSLKTLFGTLLRPIAWCMGLGWQHADEVGHLLGLKISLNEFVAYASLAEQLGEGMLSHRAEIISIYAICGFANFASIGIQIGGISAIAPSRRTDLSRIAFRAMLGGAIASWMTATIAGIMIA